MFALLSADEFVSVKNGAFGVISVVCGADESGYCCSSILNYLLNLY